jgi:hypothetical protein
MKMMLERQADLSFKRHRQLSLYYSRCLAKVQMNKVTGEDAKALIALGEWGFELWLQFKSEATNYKQHQDASDEFNVNIVRIGQNAPPRRIGPGLSCDCRSCVAYGSICPHHICYREGTFCLDDWPSRFHQVTELEQSSVVRMRQTADEIVMEKDDSPEIVMDWGEFENESNKENFQTDGMEEDEDSDESATHKTDEANVPESRAPESRVESKVNFGLMMDLSKSLAETVTKLRHSEREKFAGALVVLQRAASGQQDQTPMELEEHLQSYLSCFSKYQTSNLFNRENSSEFAFANNGGQGKLRSVRLQSKAERLYKNKKQKATCTLCKKPGHKSGRNCALLSSLKAVLVPNDTAKTEYVRRLGDSRFLLVEEPSRFLLREVFSEAVCVLPDTFHLHLKRAYYSENWMSFMTTRGNARSLSQVELPQVGENIVEIQCLGEGGTAMSNTPTMATVDAVKDWIRGHASKKKRVMCSLSQPKPEDIYKKMY